MPSKKFSDLRPKDIELAKELIAEVYADTEEDYQSLMLSRVYYGTRDAIKAHAKENKGAFTKAFLEYVDTDDFEWQKFVGFEFEKLYKI